MSWHWRMIALVWPRQGGWGGERWDSKCVCLGVALRTEGSMSSNVSVCACVFGSGGGLNGHGGWKAKVFKGDGICRHAYCNTVSCSYWYSAVIPDLVHWTTNPLLSCTEKNPLFSSWSYSTLMKWSIFCLFYPLRSLKGSLGSKGCHWFFFFSVISPKDTDKKKKNVIAWTVIQ